VNGKTETIGPYEIALEERVGAQVAVVRHGSDIVAYFEVGGRLRNGARLETAGDALLHARAWAERHEEMPRERAAQLGRYGLAATMANRRLA
jgi:hypothetical protein